MSIFERIPDQGPGTGWCRGLVGKKELTKLGQRISGVGGETNESPLHAFLLFHQVHAMSSKAEMRAMMKKAKEVLPSFSCLSCVFSVNQPPICHFSEECLDVRQSGA